MDLITDQEIIVGYLSDASNTHGQAEALLRPTSAQETAEIVKLCQKYSIPLTVTAQRSSTTGASVPHGGWLLSTEQMNRIISTTEAEGGVILGEYQDYVEHQGLLFPPDPTSRRECSLGAAIACNASGARSFRYGSIRPWVEAVEVVLPTGEIQIVDRKSKIPTEWPSIGWQEPPVKTAAGYYPGNNLLDMMIGQEGTLGIITKAWLTVIHAPTEVLGMIVFFPSVSACLQFVDKARLGAERPGQKASPESLNPRAIEYFDQHSMELIRARVDNIPEAAQCGLFMEIEYDDEPPLEQWFEALEKADALCDDIIAADDDESRNRLYTIRHAIPAGVNEIVIANGMPKIGTDFSVPDQALRRIMEIYSEVKMRHVLFGHIGDNHLHLNLLPASEQELIEARQLYRKLAHEALSLGGSVSAEHGIGKIKKSLLADMVGTDALAAFRALKHQIDPNWILGRGNLFDMR